MSLPLCGFLLFLCLARLEAATLFYGHDPDAISGANLAERAETCSWTYGNGAEGPAHWGELCDGAYAECSEGLEQSPVNIVGATENAEAFKSLEFSYHNQKENSVQRVLPKATLRKVPKMARDAALKDNGHTLIMSWPSQPPSTMGGGPLPGTFALEQFHFHAPGETTFNGLRYPLCVHFVHSRNVSGQVSLAVFDVSFEIGYVSGSSFLSTLFQHIPKEANQTTEVAPPDVEKLIGDTTAKGFYFFNGSLTTPPCSEGVSWVVARAVAKATKDEIEAFVDALHGNYRPVQALNGRKILAYAPGSSSGGGSSSRDVAIVLIVIGVVVLVAIAVGLVVRKYFLVKKADYSHVGGQNTGDEQI